MIPTSDFKKGLFIEIEKIPYMIVECQHVKPGKGNAFIRSRIKNLTNGNVIDKTFKSGERVDEPNLDHKQTQFLYKDADGYQFMDMESFEQLTLNEDLIGDRKFYLTDNLQVEILYFNNKPIALEVPNFVQLKVVYTEPGIKGDTASGGGKPAQMSTGLTVTVPFHIKQDELLKIDTRDGSYVEKIK